MADLCGGSIFWGFMGGAFIASTIWLVWMGRLFDRVQREFANERRKWNRVHLLNTRERQQLDDVVDNLTDWDT